jgi:hypothetical protein
MLEAQQLLASGINADVLVGQAEEALFADRAERAAFLLSVARQRGGAVIGDLGQRVEDALDREDSTRAQARAIEDEAETGYTQFEALRLRALGAARVGVSSDGTAGNGSSESITRANVARKMAAFASGGDFSDVAPAASDS